MSYVIRIKVTVVSSVMFISSYMDHESITPSRTVTVSASASKSWAEERHIAIVVGMSPHPCILHIIAVSPIPRVGLLCHAMSHEAVVLLQVVDLHQPPSVQLALCPGLKPIVSDLRKQVLVARLQLLCLKRLDETKQNLFYLALQVFPLWNCL